MSSSFFYFRSFLVDRGPALVTALSANLAAAALVSSVPLLSPSSARANPSSASPGIENSLARRDSSGESETPLLRRSRAARMTGAVAMPDLNRNVYFTWVPCC